jgi:glutamyl-tRNA synthetase
MSVRVRFAPSPTGALHIGGVRTALYNYLFAKKNQGQFILRVEDTDQTRYVPGAEEYIVEALEWLGLQADESPAKGGPHGPYRQSERKDLYAQYADQLLQAGKAYYAFDTPEELAALRDKEPNFTYNHHTRGSLRNSLNLPESEWRELLDSGAPSVVRLLIEPNQEILIDDLIRGRVVFQSSELDDKVLLKNDGMPTYHLANIVDDHLMEITHVIRGEEWLSSTAHHVLLYEGLGWKDTMPQFAHLPLILKPVGNGKLSKRDGAKFGIPVFPLYWSGQEGEEPYDGFREAGFLPEAVLNFLALLGWHPEGDQELFTLDELIDAFSIEQINKSGARFDYDKAKWFNEKYIQQMDPAALARLIQPQAVEKGYRSDLDFLEKVAAMMQERVTFIDGFVDQAYYLFEPVRTYDEGMIGKKWKPELTPAFEALTEAFGAAESYDAQALEESIKVFMEKEELKPGAIFPLLRLAFAGTMKGPAIFDMAAALGKEETVNRLKSALLVFNKQLAG